MKIHSYYIYILTNWNNKVLYIGMTNNIERRIYEHKNKLIEGFTKKYNLNKMVYYEQYSDVNQAIRREKKNKFIESMNPLWKDLSAEMNI